MDASRSCPSPSERVALDEPNSAARRGRSRAETRGRQSRAETAEHAFSRRDAGDNALAPRRRRRRSRAETQETTLSRRDAGERRGWLRGPFRQRRPASGGSRDLGNKQRIETPGCLFLRSRGPLAPAAGRRSRKGRTAAFSAISASLLPPREIVFSAHDEATTQRGRPRAAG